EQGPYSTGRQEAPGGVGDELRSVIAADEPRRPVDGHEALLLPHHARRREAAAHVDRQGVTARLVDDGQDLQAPAVSGGVHHEIKRPHLVRYRRHAPLAAVTRLTQPPALDGPLRHLQALLAPQALHALTVHAPPLPLKQGRDEIGRAPSELQSRENLVCRLL